MKESSSKLACMPDMVVQTLKAETEITPGEFQTSDGSLFGPGLGLRGDRAEVQIPP
jgi:hypothetical protein